MAGTFTAVNLSELPPPDVIEPLDFEAIFADMLATLQALDPIFTALVESDPAYKILEVCAYRELQVRQRVNDGANAVMLAYATGADLDNLAANFDVSRRLIQPADDTVIPPIPAVYESDEVFRRRVVLSLEGYTTAGSVGSYQFHALSASGDVLDVSVASPPITPGVVNVAILSRTGDGTAPPETLAAVVAALNAEDVRPLNDTVIVASAVILPYAINATLTFYPGVGKDEVMAEALQAAQDYTMQTHANGFDVVESGVHHALHQPGVHKVELTGWTDIIADWNQASWCTAINLTDGGTNE